MFNAQTERNIKIVEMMKLGEFTLQEIGDMYGVSRERIRQIYKRHTGEGYRLRLTNEQKHKLEELNSVAFNCVECGNPEHNDIKEEYKICRECRRKYRKEQRNPYILKKCSYCGDNFHPFRNRGPKQRNMFCSIRCHWDNINDLSNKKVGLLTRLERMIKRCLK